MRNVIVSEDSGATAAANYAQSAYECLQDASSPKGRQSIPENMLQKSQSKENALQISFQQMKLCKSPKNLKFAQPVNQVEDILGSNLVECTPNKRID